MNAAGAAGLARALRDQGQPGSFLHERFCDPGVGRTMLEEVDCGFYEGASARIPEMLVGRDVSSPA